METPDYSDGLEKSYWGLKLLRTSLPVYWLPRYEAPVRCLRINFRPNARLWTAGSENGTA